MLHVNVVIAEQEIMASTFGATSTVGLMAAPTGIVSDKKPSSLSSVSSVSVASRPRNARLQRKCNFRVKAAKELYFNKDGSAIKKLQVSSKVLGHILSNFGHYDS